MNSRRGGQLYCFALGVIAVLGQAPFHLWFITIVCLACLVARLKLARKRDKPNILGFSDSFCFAFGYFISGTYWIGSAFIARGARIYTNYAVYGYSPKFNIGFFLGLSRSFILQNSKKLSC
jgi:apolipoprotein N-acyltransferase